MVERHYYEPLLRFDMYAPVWRRNKWELERMFTDMSHLGAQIVAGIELTDFIQSIEQTGWVGSCPEWYGFKPIITVPRGDKLDADHLEFAVESL